MSRGWRTGGIPASPPVRYCDSWYCYQFLLLYHKWHLWKCTIPNEYSATVLFDWKWHDMTMLVWWMKMLANVRNILHVAAFLQRVEDGPRGVVSSPAQLGHLIDYDFHKLLPPFLSSKRKSRYASCIIIIGLINVKHQSISQSVWNDATVCT